MPGSLLSALTEVSRPSHLCEPLEHEIKHDKACPEWDACSSKVGPHSRRWFFILKGPICMGENKWQCDCAMKIDPQGVEEIEME